jgi:hypothetical protein
MAARVPAPPPTRNRNRVALAAAIGVTICLAVGVVLVRGGTAESGGAAAATGSAAGGVANEAITPTAPTETGTVTNGVPAPTESTIIESGPAPPAADPELQAQASLDAYRQQDLRRISFRGQWVAQLASKVPGITDPYEVAMNGTHTFYAADILAEHEQLRNNSSLADVYLLLSTDYGKRQLFNGEPLWVTFADGEFASADAVRAWCAAQFAQFTGRQLDNSCSPRRLRRARP